ncbi:MAG: MOSC domain-containing protein [Rhabdaerophilum sp.]
MGLIEALHLSETHRFSKDARSSLTLLAGRGVEGDAHCGETVKHRSRVAVDPSQPNLRQVHLVHAELFAELARKGFSIRPGDIGENVTTSGIDLLALPRGTLLHLGEQAVLEVTGLRNPCLQLNHFREGLTQAVLDRAPDGSLVRKSGIMSIVREGGVIHSGDAIRVMLPPKPYEKLERV